MSNVNAFSVNFNVFGDGTATTFTLDLNRDSYNLATGQQNWNPKVLTRVVVNDSRIASASISAGVISISFVGPFTGVQSLSVYVS